MIKSFDVTGLNGSLDQSLKFQSDLNIITGRNGSGKTTILKLLWYMFSGNIERTQPEIKFRTTNLVGDNYRVSMDLYSGEKEEVVEIKWKVGKGKERKISFPRDQWNNNPGPINKANRDIAKASGGSLFFPTFRRIEGGFSIDDAKDIHALGRGFPLSIRDALQIYVENISVYDHRFITTVSTDDITRLVTERYADMSEETNKLHQRLSTFIIDKIDDIEGKKVKSAEQSVRRQDHVLRQIRREAKSINDHRDKLMIPFSVLQDLTREIFQNKGIAISQNVSFGESRAAVQSEKLSSGEKQMLGFLCYNAFLSDNVIIIDEPEISLHVDWQRILFPTLLRQSRNNQFIVATHSPMIYAKYPEKELILNSNRGDE